MKLVDKVAIVTGGGRGIGRAIALAFAREGADVVIASRTLPELEETITPIRALGRQSIAVKADVSRWNDVNHLMRETLKTFGKIDILVNNAGIQGPIGAVVDNDIDEWIHTVHVNLVGTFLCTRAVLSHMIERRQGKIINLSGGGATAARPHFSAYAASKAAVVRLTETVAEEVKPFNIEVNAIAPGAVSTRMLQEVMAAGEGAGLAELARAKQQLEGRGASPEGAAELVVFLASSESNRITGKLISAVYDEWKGWTGLTDELSRTDLYTLRRLDPFTIRKLSPHWCPPWEQQS